MPIDLSQAISTSEARERFSDLVNRASFGQERIILTRRGKPVAAVVPFEDVQWMEDVEDEEDIREAKKIKEGIARGEKVISLDELLEKYNIKRSEL